MTAVRLVIDKLWYGSPLTGDDVVVILLVVAMGVSLIHLLTMLITRWGDHYLALKSLTASLLVHCVCLLGLEVFDPLQPDYVEASTQVLAPVAMTTQLQTPDEQQAARTTDSDSAPPDLPLRSQIDLERLAVPEPPEADTTDAERAELPTDDLQPDMSDVTELIAAQPQRPVLPEDALSDPAREVAADEPDAEIDPQIAAADETEKIRQDRTPKERVPADDDPVQRERRSDAAESIDTRLDPGPVASDIAMSSAPDGVRVPEAFPPNLNRRGADPGLDGPDQLADTDPAIERRRTPDEGAFDRLAAGNLNTLEDEPGAVPQRLRSEASQPLPIGSDYEDVVVQSPGIRRDVSSRAAAEDVDLAMVPRSRSERQPLEYRLRSQDYRRDAVWEFGGSERSEATVERSLRWLVARQSADGRWDADAWGAGQVKVDELGINRDFCGRDADTGITALVTLAFLGAGYTHEDGRYAMPVDRALNWLMQQQSEEGSLSGDARHYARMYCHAMATYALAEALGMQKDVSLSPPIHPRLLATAPLIGSATAGHMSGVPGCPSEFCWILAVDAAVDSEAWRMRQVSTERLRSSVLEAVRFTLSRQHRDGGWRYAAGQEGDVSMFGWQLMSLKSAEIAGVQLPSEVRDRMFRFVRSVRQGRSGGKFGYRRDEPVSPVMTAEALFCQQMLGFRRGTAANRESVSYLLQNVPRLSEINLYYWYYGTLAMYQYGGKPWERWNAAVRDTLIGQQVAQGPNAGSWDPNGPWGRYGGRLYSTALATLTLEVYYRLLPLYRMNSSAADKR